VDVGLKWDCVMLLGGNYAIVVSVVDGMEEVG
jgi:hypothetical protein